MAFHFNSNGGEQKGGCGRLSADRSASGLLMLLEPTGEDLVVHAVERGETRTAQTAGLVGFDQGGLLVLGIAKSTSAVGL